MKGEKKYSDAMKNKEIKKNKRIKTLIRRGKYNSILNSLNFK